jgi:hypothetical protein
MKNKLINGFLKPLISGGTALVIMYTVLVLVLQSQVMLNILLITVAVLVIILGLKEMVTDDK